MRNWAIFVSTLLTVSLTWAQNPQLEQRPEAPPKPAIPPPLKPPETRETAHPANGNVIYQALRNRTINGDAFTVKNAVLRRDVGVLTLSGTVYLSTPVAGHTTSAVFLGEGTLHVEPPNLMERRELK